ncbi:MAG: hypothetical protein QW412_02180, partial [Candidatus Aenigmatarchaeota archaeon]
PQQAIEFLFENKMKVVNFLLNNYHRQIQKGYVAEDVRLSLKSRSNRIYADVGVVLPSLRNGKSKLEEIILKYKDESLVDVKSG